MINVIFKCGDPETWDYHYFTDRPTRNKSPGCRYSKKLSCLRLIRSIIPETWKLNGCRNLNLISSVKRTCPYQGVRNVRFSEILACFAFLVSPRMICPFALLQTNFKMWKLYILVCLLKILAILKCESRTSLHVVQYKCQPGSHILLLFF